MLDTGTFNIGTGKIVLFEALLHQSPCKVWMMHVLYFYRLSLKVLDILSQASLTFHVTSVHAQQIWRQNLCQIGQMSLG